MPEPQVETVQEELDRLRRWKAEALPVLAGLQRLGRVLDLPLGASISDLAADAVTQLIAERDGARAAMAEARTYCSRPLGVCLPNGANRD